MTELTRRQMRELERQGKQPVVERVVLEPVAAEPVIASTPVVSIAPVSTPVITSRRQLREQASVAIAEVVEPAVVLKVQVAEERSTSQEVAEDFARPEPIAPRRLAPLPPVGSRRSLRVSGPEESVAATSSRVVPDRPEGPVNLEPIEVEIPEDGFRGANYLGEPSTQSIMLEIAPEAISLPLDTGEVFTTGSIAILPEAPGPSTGGLDGVELDITEDAVTGVLSVVDPVSAKSLIDDRSPLGVVPDRVLRKGWWRPWVVGAVSLIMAIAAILASITILNALGE